MSVKSCVSAKEFSLKWHLTLATRFDNMDSTRHCKGNTFNRFAMQIIVFRTIWHTQNP